MLYLCCIEIQTQTKLTTMKTITIDQVAAMKNEDVRYYEANRQYVGNAETDQRIEFVLRQSDVDYMNQHNELVRNENKKLAAKKEAKSKLAAERKATGKSKKTYRAEYDQLMSEYKSTGNRELYLQAKSIAKYAF